jgi:tetratricopeptide (TPR) repeat protein
MKLSKHTKLSGLITLFLCFAVTLSLTANDQENYRKANQAYQQKEYDKAIELYGNLEEKGIISHELFYNLGNAWYKKGDIAHAILYYERALKINPGDEDAAFNLKLTTLKVIDKIDAVPQIFYKRWVITITSLMTPKGWSITLIIFLWTALIFALIFLFGNSTGIRKTGFYLMLVFLFLFLITFIPAGKSHTMYYIQKNAIIMTPSVYVKSSPDEKGNDLFIIHEGTKVEVLEELNNWYKIKLLNGNIGWLLSSETEII